MGRRNREGFSLDGGIKEGFLRTGFSKKRPFFWGKRNWFPKGGAPPHLC